MRISRTILLLISFINGVSGLVCGTLFVIAPDGSLMKSEGIIPMLASFPLRDVFFRDLFWVGVVMVLVLFIPNAVAFSMQVTKQPLAYGAQMAAGICLMAWCVVEIIWLPNPLVYVYLAIAALQIILAIRVGNSHKQTQSPR